MAQTEQFLPEFCDIEIERVVCRDARIGVKLQSPPSMIHGITLRHSTIFCSETLSEIPEDGMMEMEDVRLLGY